MNTDSSSNYYAFRYAERVVAFRASNWADDVNNSSNHNNINDNSNNNTSCHFVYVSDLEQHFGTRFPAHLTRFSLQGTSLSLERGPDLNVLIPERIGCIAGQIIDISELDSGSFPSTLTSIHSHRITADMQLVQLSPDRPTSTTTTIEGKEPMSQTTTSPSTFTRPSPHALIQTIPGAPQGFIDSGLLSNPPTTSKSSSSSSTSSTSSSILFQTPHQGIEDSDTSNSILDKPPPTTVPRTLQGQIKDNDVETLFTGTTVEFYRKHASDFKRRALIFTKADELLSKRFKVGDDEEESPRLFVVLPDKSTSLPTTENRVAGAQQHQQQGHGWQGQCFRIYFLCQSGQDNSTGSTHLDLENGTGYLIRNPKQFFENFGPVLLIMLEIIRLGMEDVGGHRFEPLETSTRPHKQQQNLLSRIETAIQYLERLYDSTNPSGEQDPLLQNQPSEYQRLKKYLTDIKKIDLKTVSEFVITPRKRDQERGLFRTQDGNQTACWICKKHYRKMFLKSDRNGHPSQQKLIKLFKEKQCLLLESKGYIRASPKSTLSADDLYEAILETPSNLQELDLTLDWNQDYGDLLHLRRTILRTKISTLSLNLKNFSGPEIELTYQARYSPIFDIMRHSSIRSVRLRDIKGLWSRSVVPNGDTIFSHLKSLWIVWPAYNDRHRVEKFLTQAKNLEKFRVTVEVANWDDMTSMLNTVISSRKNGNGFKALEFSFSQSGSSFPALRMLLPENSNLDSLDRKKQQEPILFRNLAEFIQYRGTQFQHVGLEMNRVELSALVEATLKPESKLTTFLRGFSYITDVDRNLCVQVIAQSQLTRFRGYEMSNSTAISVLNVIQWRYLTTLYLSFEDQDPIPAVSRLNYHLANTKTGPVMSALRYFGLFIRNRLSSSTLITTTINTSTTMIKMTTEKLFCQLVANLTIEKLFLNFDADLEFWLAVVGAIDYSRLEILGLESRYQLTNQSQMVLDRILQKLDADNGNDCYGRDHCSTKVLHTLSLAEFDPITESQVDLMMKHRGIVLNNSLFYLHIPALFA